MCRSRDALRCTIFRTKDKLPRNCLMVSRSPEWVTIQPCNSHCYKYPCEGCTVLNSHTTRSYNCLNNYPTQKKVRAVYALRDQEQRCAAYMPWAACVAARERRFWRCGARSRLLCISEESSPAIVYSGDSVLSMLCSKHTLLHGSCIDNLPPIASSLFCMPVFKQLNRQYFQLETKRQRGERVLEPFR